MHGFSWKSRVWESTSVSFYARGRANIRGIVSRTGASDFPLRDQRTTISASTFGRGVRTSHGSDWVLELEAPQMWNDTEIPLAIFFAFRAYGTWLHGDERGSVDRKKQPLTNHHDLLVTEPGGSATNNCYLTSFFSERILPKICGKGRERHMHEAEVESQRV